MVVILVLITLWSGIAWAQEKETKISLSLGTYTGATGFLFEYTNGLPAVYGGFGITSRSLRVVAGGRIYMPDQGALKRDVIKRSNVFIGPAAGIIWEHVTEWDLEKNEEIYTGIIPNFWAGITGGYDFKWGQYDEYHLTLEGGMGYKPSESTEPYMPIFNVSLGYSF